MHSGPETPESCCDRRNASQAGHPAPYFGSRKRSIDTCETHAPGDSMTNDWRFAFVRTVNRAVIVSLSTFASIRPLSFFPETLPPWRYWLSNQLPESVLPFCSILAP